VADLIQHGRDGGRTRSSRWWIVLGSLLVATAGTTVAFVALMHGDDSGHRVGPPVVTPPPTTTSADCTAAASREALRDFVRAWNHHDDKGLTSLLAAHAELDMSTDRQRALPPARGGGYTFKEGTDAIIRFVHSRWRLGERLSFERGAPFPGGIVAVNMLAKFSDGRFQPMVEAKFALDCPRQSFKHIVIGAGEIAR
jgi:hypothetical protein